MKTRRNLSPATFIAALGSLAAAALNGQTPPVFTTIQPLTNKEVRLQLNAPTGRGYRIDASTNLPSWTPLITLTGATTSLQLTDSAAPYLGTRFYRAEQLSITNLLTGDHLATADGDVVIHPLYHASFVMSWNGKIIYNDPDDDPIYETTYRELPKADLILISHSHGDHLSTTKIEALRGTNAVIVVPKDVYDRLTAAQKAIAIILGSGLQTNTYPTTTNIMGLTVEAVHSYNSNHSPAGFGNGYVVTIGGRRIYMSGDTGNQPEVRAIPNIDVAFLCMNTPFTMDVTQATNCIRAMRPKVVYPYHYRDSTGATTNAASFKQRLGADLGIEVRLRKWY